jgi:hypothetical protein
MEKIIEESKQGENLFFRKQTREYKKLFISYGC